MRYLLTLGFMLLLAFRGFGQFILEERDSNSNNYYNSYHVNADNTFKYLYGGCFGSGEGVGRVYKKKGKLIMKFDSITPPSPVVIGKKEAGGNGIKIQFKRILGKDTIVLSRMVFRVLDTLNNRSDEYRADSNGVAYLTPSNLIGEICNFPKTARFTFNPTIEFNSYDVYPVFDYNYCYIKAGTIHTLIRKGRKKYIYVSPHYEQAKRENFPKSAYTTTLYLSKDTVKE